MAFKTAVIGSGLIATVKHLPALGRLRDQTELVAVCDVDEEKARSIASKFGVPRYYTSIDELLEREKPDLVDVCTPPRT
ncbi:MAG: Gfo/Idh/MocA family oxidoreductase, partial [Chloroflexi bacterium]|nr:Gfo/Idh/MocA family oxidoreductase [Chloroflexota bacterium]